MLQPENLDGLTPNEVEAYEWQARMMAQGWTDLARYAQTKAKAMHYRNSGLVEYARQCEQTLEAIYRDLPAWARW